MAEKKNLASIAKKSGTTTKTNSKSTTKKPAARKTTARKTTKKPAEKKLTAAEERDLKAKQKVEELLKDSNLTAKKGDDLLELDESSDKEYGVEWLEEQVGKQADLIEKLRSDLATTKTDYQKLYGQYETLKKGKGVSDEGDVKNNVIKVFNELQENYIKMGVSASGQPNFRIVPVAFMNRMIMFFPFLKEHKKYK